MNELIQYIKHTESHAKYLVKEFTRLRNEQEFNIFNEAPLYAALSSWFKEYQEIENKKQSIILEYEAQNIPCESLIKHLQSLHDFIYHELIEWELKKLNDKINLMFVRFTFDSRKQLKFFIERLKKLDANQKASNLNGFDNLNEVIAHFKAYLINVEGIVKYDIPHNLTNAKKRLESLAKDDLSEEISIKSFWAKMEIEKQLLKGGLGVEVLFKKAIDDLDFIFLEFERLAKEYKLNHADLFHDMLPFHQEFGFTFAPFFCWVKSIQPHKSKVPKSVCAKLTDHEPTEAENQILSSDKPTQEVEFDIPLNETPFKSLKDYKLFLYLHANFNENKKLRYTYIYKVLNQQGKCKLAQEKFMLFISTHYEPVAKRVQETADNQDILQIVEGLFDEYAGMQ